MESKKGNTLITTGTRKRGTPPLRQTDDTSEIVCIERLGGLLKSYHRLAA